jgi:ABC-2 type transport system ATP-binding protein
MNSKQPCILNPIEILSVSKRIGKINALNGISFSVSPGDIFGFLGPNGAGKTTTIRIILGLLKPTTGQVRLWNEDPWENSFSIKSQIGVVLDEPGLFEHVSLIENLIFYGKLYKLKKNTMIENIDNILSYFNLIDRKNDKVGSFSKGMKKKAALARALLVQPKLLIMDEPTAGLDPESSKELRDKIKDIAQVHKVTVFFSSHNLDEVDKICNRIAIIHRGNIIALGDIQTVRDSPSSFKKKMRFSEKQDVEKIKNMVIDILPVDMKITFDYHNDLFTVLSDKEADTSLLIAALTSNGLKIKEIYDEKASLEEVYLKCIKEAEG